MNTFPAAVLARALGGRKVMVRSDVGCRSEAADDTVAAETTAEAYSVVVGIGYLAEIVGEIAGPPWSSTAPTAPRRSRSPTSPIQACWCCRRPSADGFRNGAGLPSAPSRPLNRTQQAGRPGRPLKATNERPSTRPPHESCSCAPAIVGVVETPYSRERLRKHSGSRKRFPTINPTQPKGMTMTKPAPQIVPPALETPALDPFDPANLRLSQAFTETAGVKKLLTTIPVRKPGAQDFVRVHPSPEYREDFPINRIKGSRGAITSLLPASCPNWLAGFRSLETVHRH